MQSDWLRHHMRILMNKSYATSLIVILLALLLSACSSTPTPPLVSAVRSDASESELQRLVSSGANLEARDSDTWSPLEVAAGNGNLEAARVLVEAGANVNAEDGGGRTPLYWAMDSDHRDVATYLVEQGASLTFGAQPNSGWAPSWLQQAYDMANAEAVAEQQAVAEALAAENAEQEQQRQIEMLESRISEQQMRDAGLASTIRRDKYLVAFSNAMKEQSYPDALFYAELLERTGLPVDDSLYYFWGEALLELNQTEGSLEKLSEYLNRSGSSGQYYTQTLQLMLRAESM